MPSVTLTKPITHNKVRYVVGDPVHDLTEREAERLVRLGVAVRGEIVTVKDEPDENETAPGITPEQVAQIKKMRKPELLEALAAAGIAADDSEKVADLKDKLTAVWSGTSTEGDCTPSLSSEETEEIDAMDREALLEALDAANISVAGKDTDDQLRTKLKQAWSEEAEAMKDGD